MAASNRFFWYELLTTDVAAATSFYSDVVGWTASDWGGGGEAAPYTIVNAAGRGVGGIMRLPDEVDRMGGGPAWIGYVHVDDADARTEAIRAAGGHVHREPDDIPGVGRFSVVADPQGAVFMLLAPTGDDQPPADPMTPGHVGWHELYAADWPTALAFYEAQFGWSATTDFDMGGMGTYQLFSMGGGGDDGGMMNKMPEMPMPFWSFYFIVEGIDAAAQRVTQGGGRITMDPMEVPGGSWVLQAVDPQGAAFALVSLTR